MIQFALDTYGLSAYGLWTMLKMNLNTNMNSDLTQIIWSKMSVYIISGCSRAWMKVDGVHTFLCKKISILYVLCIFLALQTSGAHQTSYGVHPLLFQDYISA